MDVDVWADIACPWCMLGLAHLEEASRRTGVPVQVRLRSFQLSPHLQGVRPVRDYLQARYGSALEASQERLRRMGAEVGVRFDFAAALAANTFDAHRLIHVARDAGLEPAVTKALFRAQHEAGLDVSDRDVLFAIAVDAGMDGEALAAWRDDAGSAGVEADLVEARRRGVQGVPLFVVGHGAVSGAQPVAVFESLLRR